MGLSKKSLSILEGELWLLKDEGVSIGFVNIVDVVGSGAVATISGRTGTLTITTSGAPTDADYLVGTANGDLSAEIVVGTTPGGELGNTWASPTVDSTHSGSAHHTKYTDAEAVSAVEAAGVTFAENFGITLDAALSADGKWSGTVIAGTAGAALAFGDLVYFAVADSKWELTDADAAATAGPVWIGICVLAAIEDAATTILLWGKVRADAVFPTLTIGAPAYVGLTAGDIVTTAPSASADIVRIVGYGITANELMFCPDNTYVEIA